MKHGLLIAPTAADIRDVVVTGSSGILATANPREMPKWESSKRQVRWPNGATAICISGEEPDRARGHNVDTIWADELVAWQKAEQTWKLAMLALRIGSNPQALITTTPKKVELLERPEKGPTDLLNWIFNQPNTKVTSESTYANQRHLAKEFMDQIVSLYSGTRLGQQEIYAQLLDLIAGAWFANFSKEKHVDDVVSEYHPGYPVCLAIDCGVSIETGAVFYQTRYLDQHRKLVTVFGDFYSKGSFSAKTAADIRQHAYTLPCQGRIDKVRLDPAATARSGVGPAAFGEYSDVFGSSITAHWPRHGVVDGLDQMEVMLDRGCLVLHSRAKNLIDAFVNYRREQSKSGVVGDKPADPQHPAEEMIDSMRGGIRDAFPEGHRPGPAFGTRHASQI